MTKLTYQQLLGLDEARTQGEITVCRQGGYISIGTDGFANMADVDFYRAAPQAYAMMKRYREGLEAIATPRYPEKTFTPLTDEDWKAIRQCCLDRGFDLDRLSGEYGRMFAKGLQDIALQALLDDKEG